MSQESLSLQTLGYEAVLSLLISFFLVIGLMGFLMWFGWWITRQRGSLCPYTKKPMGLGVDIAPSLAAQVESFLASLPQPENPPFDLAQAALSEETGRLFPNCVVRGVIVRLKWDFLSRRYPGKWISWGSVSGIQKAEIEQCHESLEGFQTLYSSRNPLPKDIDPFCATALPGPLYVDLETKILMGWQRVPGTDFEVLVVQKPKYESIESLL